MVNPTLISNVGVAVGSDHIYKICRPETDFRFRHVGAHYYCTPTQDTAALFYVGITHTDAPPAIPATAVQQTRGWTVSLM